MKMRQDDIRHRQSHRLCGYRVTDLTACYDVSFSSVFYSIQILLISLLLIGIDTSRVLSLACFNLHHFCVSDLGMYRQLYLLGRWEDADADEGV